MSIQLEHATPESLDEIVEAVSIWQQDGMPVQLHPGDLGWSWRFGGQALAKEVRAWRRDGQILAAGTVDDEDGLIRMAIAPSVDADEAFAARLLADLSDPGRGVLPAGRGSVEARSGAAFRDLLHRSGWTADEPWTPLCRDLTSPVEDCALRVEVLDADHVEDRVLQDRVSVHRASWPNSTFTVERWRAMAASSAYRPARCLVAYDRDGNAVATTTIWSAGHGRPGLIEPLGAHRDHRGHGHGRTITLAAAAALQEMGRPPPQSAPRAATSAAWRRTSRPASRSSRTSPISAAQADPARWDLGRRSHGCPQHGGRCARLPCRLSMGQRLPLHDAESGDVAPLPRPSRPPGRS